MKNFISSTLVHVTFCYVSKQYFTINFYDPQRNYPREVSYISKRKYTSTILVAPFNANMRLRNIVRIFLSIIFFSVLPTLRINTKT